uniref:EGF-like domain-containing protein n=1 Tax=Timema monikensis TaxID=170555 RepID=A0A7R9EA98_9NEOP|nr:unnamed protein product [Timema monikensis]
MLRAGKLPSSYPNLLFATVKDIRLANISKPTKTVTIVKNLEEGAAVDFYYEGNLVCWTEHGLEMIQCVSYNGTYVGPKLANALVVLSSAAEDGEIEMGVVTTDLISPDGLAIDWFTQKLYWTDGETNRIEVASITGEHRKVLIWSDIDQPRAIALVPMKKFMFWTDWGEVPKIERVGMNGDPKTRKIIVSKDIFWPNGLTVDYATETVYWLDGRLKFIASIDYEGRNRCVLAQQGVVYPFALAMFNNKIYWTDWGTWSIYMLDKTNCSGDHERAGGKAVLPKELFHSEYVPMRIRVWDPARQPPGETPCQKDNGGCSHLCLLAPYSPWYTCACPTGVKLVDNLTCADGPQELLLLAQRTDICRISLDSPDYTNFVIPLQGVKHAIAIDFDPVEEYLYWTDDEARALRRAHLDGSNQEDLIVTEVEHPDGIAVDWVARNIYWTDTGTDRIEVARLTGASRKVLINDDLLEPRAIALAPEKGWMFWSDWNERHPKIERASLDGSDRFLLVDTNLGWPNGIALDLNRNKIYWCDAKTDKIEVSNMDGSDRREMINDNVPHIFGISLLGDHLYWTDWQRRSIERVDLTGESRQEIVDQLPNVMGLKAVRLGKVEGSSNPCSRDNGGCSHLCLNRPGNNYVCACQIGYELTADERTCVVPEAFLLFARRENIGRISIENGNNDVIIPVTGVKDASALDFDITDNRIYWTDVKLKTITRAFMNGSDVERIVEFGLESPEGMAVDWVAHNIYWTDTGSKRIEVARLDGSSRKVLLWNGVDDPRSLALDPREGNICYNIGGIEDLLEDHGQDGWTKHRRTRKLKEQTGDACLKEKLREIDRNGEGCARQPAEVETSIDDEYRGGQPSRHKSSSLDVSTSVGRLAQPPPVLSIPPSFPLYHVHKYCQLELSLAYYVNPIRYMYWSDWGDMGRIERAAMDGSRRTVLIGKLGRANGLTIDYVQRRLYWTEITSPAIESADLDGGRRVQVVTQGIEKPYGLTQYQDYIYWTDWKTGNIECANKTTGCNRTRIHAQLEYVTDILVFHNSRQSGWNQCAVGNGGCSHLCLALPSPGGSGANSHGATPNRQSYTHRCGCPTHYILAGDNVTCLAPRSFLLLSQKNSLSRLVPDTADCPDIVLPVQGLKNVRAVEFDPVSQFLYWVDGRAQSIKRVYDNGTHAGPLVPGGNHHPYDLAVDPYGRFLYWTCAIADTINVTRLDNGSSVGVVFAKAEGEKPRNIALHPEKGLMFWTDVGSNPRILRALMDGQKRIVIASDLDMFAALAVDRVDDLLFWAHLKTLETSDLFGKGRRVLARTQLVTETSLVVHGDHLYWLDRDQQHIERVNKRSGGGRQIVLARIAQLTHLVAVNFPSKQMLANHGCSPENHAGGCSHLCHATPSNSTTVPAVCSCPVGMILHENRRTCSSPPACGADHFSCASPATSTECIPASWRCDGQTDCPDSSDERGCPDCRPDQFKCHSGQCIDMSWVCDGTSQCPDDFDESHCCKAPGEFMCVSTDQCIPESELCDGWENCADGSDEKHTACTIGVSKANNHRVESPDHSNKSTYVAVVLTTSVVVITVLAALYYCHRYISGSSGDPLSDELGDSAGDPLSPKPARGIPKPVCPVGVLQKNGHRVGGKSAKPNMDGVRMSMLNGSTTSNSYDRSHITGASSSTTEGVPKGAPLLVSSSSLLCYPRETLNPPPSPATTADSNRRMCRDDYCCSSSGASRFRPYRHYRTINQPPPPTPCSTDVCDESDSNYPFSPQGRHRYYPPPGSEYDSDPFPPPPTPRSHYHSDGGVLPSSCPPSPSSAGRSSTYFNPLPPPPSPVPSPGSRCDC